MISSVVRNYNWTPHYILEKLYVDDYDVYGLVFWYNDAKEQNESIKNS